MSALFFRQKHRPWIIAHRGDSSNFPENTLPAFQGALDASDAIDGFETDTQMSRDNEVVLFHDRDLSRIVGLDQRICDLTLKELKQLDFGAWFGASYRDERILTLNDLLERFGAKTRLFIEVKARDEDGAPRYCALAKKVAESIVRQNLHKTSALLSFNPHALKAAWEVAPQLCFILNVRDPALLNTPAFFETPWFGVICLHRTIVSKNLVQRIHDNGKPVFSYTCDHEDGADMLMDAGVDGIITNRPSWLSQYVQRRKCL